MSREGRLLKNTLIITLGRVCTQLISFLLLPLYTSILATEEYGIVDLLNTLVSLLLPIVTLQVEHALFRELIETRTNNDEQADILTTGLGLVTIQCIIYGVLFLSISPLIHNEYKYFLASNVVSNVFLSVFLQIARGLGENKKYAVASFASASSIIVFNIIFLVGFGLGARGMLFATLIGQILACIYLFCSLKLVKRLGLKRIEIDRIKKLLFYSIPLIPNAICWWIIDASDRVIVSSFLGVDQNGILAASLKFASLLTSVNYIFTLSWTESITLAINDEDIADYFNRMMNAILGLFISVAIGMITCMPVVYRLLIDAKYDAGYWLVPISIFATLFNIIVGLVSVVYVAKKNTKAIAKTSFFAAVINISTHLCLIRFIGLYAAVISSLIAFMVMALYRMYDINKKYFQISVSKKLIWSSIAVAVLVVVVYYINNKYLCVLSFGLACVYALMVNKSTLVLMYEMVKKRGRGRMK